MTVLPGHEATMVMLNPGVIVVTVASPAGRVSGRRTVRASDLSTDSSPAASREFQYSCGSKRSQMSPMARQSASR